MIYMYAALGVVMLSGIMAVFEMGIALTGRSLISAPPDAYSSNDQAKTLDQNLLFLLSDGDLVPNGLEGPSLCNQLKLSYEKKYPEEANLWIEDSKVPSDGWSGSCVMNNGAYRVFVRPNDSTASYQLYSCLIKDDFFCSFEQGGD